MYPISQTYSKYLRRHDTEYVVKVEINGIEYDSSKIVDFIVDNYITNMDELEIGTAIPSMLTLTLRTNETIPPNARVIPYISLSMDSLTWQDADVAWNDADWSWEGGPLEWLPLGEFYIDTRERINDVWVYTCLDKLVFADVPYVSSLSYPTSMQTVWDEICDRLGYEYDSSVVIAPYTVPVAPTGYTMRQVLGFIAGANSASIYVGKDGILRFKVYDATDTPQFELSESDYFRVKQTNPIKRYSRVVVIYDREDGLHYEAGDGGEDQTLYIENPLATQQITDDIYAKINGLAYQPIEMDSKGYPQLDQGDIISFKQSESISWNEAEMSWDEAEFTWDGIETYRSIILRQSFGFAGGLKMTIDAPSLSEQQSEFSIEGELTQQVNRLTQSAVRQGKLYYGVTITNEDGLTIERSDSAAKAVLNADELTFYKGSEKALWFDVPNDRYMFSGIIEASDFVGGTITIGSGNNVFRADTQGIWAGNSSFNNAPFRVNMQGKLWAEDAQISGTITASTFTGGFILGSFINGAVITGGTVQTAGTGIYPRIELGSGNILSAEASPGNSISISASVGGTPIMYFDFQSGGSALLMAGSSTQFAILTTPDRDIYIGAGGSLRLYASGGFVVYDSWGDIFSIGNGRTLQQELNDLWAAIASLMQT